jgi:hypothetical protein
MTKEKTRLDSIGQGTKKPRMKRGISDKELLED